MMKNLLGKQSWALAGAKTALLTATAGGSLADLWLCQNSARLGENYMGEDWKVLCQTSRLIDILYVKQKD